MKQSQNGDTNKINVMNIDFTYEELCVIRESLHTNTHLFASNEDRERAKNVTDKIRKKIKETVTVIVCPNSKLPVLIGEITFPITILLPDGNNKNTILVCGYNKKTVFAHRINMDLAKESYIRIDNLSEYFEGYVSTNQILP